MLSIIIPVYNSENTIQFTLDSILSQKLSECEIIIIDDGSTDNSRSVCESYAKKNKCIKVISQKNSGPSSARNKGIAEAKGDYITFIDADDKVVESWYEKIKEALLTYSPDILLFGFKRVRVEEENNILQFKSRQNKIFVQNKNQIIKKIPLFIEHGVFNPLWNKVYKSEIIKKNNIKLDITHTLGEDFIFNLEIFEKVEKLFCLDDFLYEQIIEETSLTNSYYDNKFKSLLKVSTKFKMYLIKHNLPLISYYKRLISNIYSTTINLFHENCSLNFQEKLQVTENLLDEESKIELLKNYNPSNLREKLLLYILKTNNKYLLLFSSRIFYYLKFNGRFYNQLSHLK